MSLIEKIDLNRMPQHIAVIMDGNGRWAKQREKSRVAGHQEGVLSIFTLVTASSQMGVKYLTLYAFSTENWYRPQDEVSSLMELIMLSLHQYIETLMDNNIRLSAIGDIERLPENTRKALDEVLEKTSRNTGLCIVLAVSYSSRWELTTAAKKLALLVKEGKLDPDQITEASVAEQLTTKDIPDPDLLIRTGGERRISNYLLWQLAYSELYFTDTFWPEFREEELFAAIVDYQHRERRFGKTSEQIQLG